VVLNKAKVEGTLYFIITLREFFCFLLRLDRIGPQAGAKEVNVRMLKARGFVACALAVLAGPAPAAAII